MYEAASERLQAALKIEQMNYAEIEPEGSGERPRMRFPLRAYARGEGGCEDSGTTPGVSQDSHDGHREKTLSQTERTTP